MRCSNFKRPLPWPTNFSAEHIINCHTIFSFRRNDILYYSDQAGHSFFFFFFFAGPRSAFGRAPDS